jgi:hypothetical protein
MLFDGKMKFKIDHLCIFDSFIGLPLKSDFLIMQTKCRLLNFYFYHLLSWYFYYSILNKR